MLDRSMWGGDDYDFLMGRWSRLMAPLLVQYADVPILVEGGKLEGNRFNVPIC